MENALKSYIDKKPQIHELNFFKNHYYYFTIENLLNFQKFVLFFIIHRRTKDIWCS